MLLLASSLIDSMISFIFIKPEIKNVFTTMIRFIGIQREWCVVLCRFLG